MNRSLLVGPRALGALGLSLFTLACAPSEGFEASCEGEVIDNCLPFEASQISMPSLTPAQVSPEDLSARVVISLQLDTCGHEGIAHRVTVQFRGEGESPRIYSVAELHDDGTEGDTLAGDGLIEKDLANVFAGSGIPAGARGTLLFEAQSLPRCQGGECTGGTCTSEPVALPYTLGS